MRLSTLLPVTVSLASATLAQTATVGVLSGGAPAAATSAAAAVATIAASSPSAQPLFSNGTSSGTTASAQGNNATAVVPSGTEKVWVVKVGAANGTFIFAPNSLAADPGDWVQFQFEPRNHSVVTGSFDSPCTPNVNSNTAANTKNVFFSGYMPTADDGLLTYTVPVVDNSPIWYYCSQGMHCQDGMVGVINPPATGPQSIQAFVAAAAKAPENISPDFGAPANPGNGNNAGASPSATSAPAGTGNGNLTVSGSAALAQSTRANDAPEGKFVSVGFALTSVVFALALM